MIEKGRIVDAHDDGHDPDFLGAHRRARDPVGTRRRLLDAAGKLMDERGDLGVRVVDVAAEAGTSVGTIYVHFRDRDALVAAVHAERFEQRTVVDVQKLREVVEADLDPGLRIAALIELLTIPDDAEFKDLRWGRIRALAASREDPMLEEVIDRSLRQVDEIFVEIIDRAKDLGLLRRDLDSRAGSLFVQALSLGLVLTDARRDPPPSPEAWGDLVNALLGAVIAPPDQPDRA